MLSVEEGSQEKHHVVCVDVFIDVCHIIDLACLGTTDVFDFINQWLLLDKLKSFCVERSVLNWMKPYLFGRLPDCSPKVPLLVCFSLCYTQMICLPLSVILFFFLQKT